VSGHGATPVGGENGGRHTVRLRGGRAGSVTQESLVPIPASYQLVKAARKEICMYPLCCRTVGTSVEGSSRSTAAFFDLDKTIIARSSTLAFAPAFYRRGLISRSQVLRGAFAQLTFRLAGAGHHRMERVRDQVSCLCRGWDASQIAQIVTDGLAEIIGPHVYTEARQLLDRHLRDGHEVLIASTSGHEIVAPIGAMLGASAVIATRLEVAEGRYTGAVDFYAYGQAKADGVRQLADERGYRLQDCFAYSDSVTDLPLLELVGHPHVVNPDRALRKIARARSWPVLAFSQTGDAALPSVTNLPATAASPATTVSPVTPVPSAALVPQATRFSQVTGLSLGPTEPGPAAAGAVRRDRTTSGM
jgi:HAD superfamily hydrolase (TIGR01490 family)